MSREEFTRRKALAAGAAFGLTATIFSNAGQSGEPAAHKPVAVPAVLPPAWQTLPPTPAWPQPSRTGYLDRKDARLFWAQFGDGAPVLFLHGGAGNSNHWGNQIAELAKKHLVTVMDTRGHGRSSSRASAVSYRLFAEDASAVMEFLDLKNVAVVGWSDGAIAGLQLALAQEKRLSKLYAFGANVTLDGYKPGGAASKTFAAYMDRCKAEYQTLAPDASKWGELLQVLAQMWRREPNISKQQLSKISIPVTIADGEHDEIIKRAHTQTVAQSIPGAKLEVIPDVSHFAMFQKPDEFNASLARFLA